MKLTYALGTEGEGLVKLKWLSLKSFENVNTLVGYVRSSVAPNHIKHKTGEAAGSCPGSYTRAQSILLLHSHSRFEEHTTAVAGVATQSHYK